MHTIFGMTRPVLIGLCLVIASTGAHAKVYHCVVNGSTTYMDRPCAGADSETVNMVAPQSNAPVTNSATANAAVKAAVNGTANAAAVPAQPQTAAVEKAPPVLAAASESKHDRKMSKSTGAGWHLAGGYSDRVTVPAASNPAGATKTLKRASYGIECEASGLRPSVYSIDDRYTLTLPDRNGINKLQGPFFDSLDAAADAACAGK